MPPDKTEITGLVLKRLVRVKSGTLFTADLQLACMYNHDCLRIELF